VPGFGYIRNPSYLYYVIKMIDMSKVNFDYDLYESKIGYDSVNKMYLIRVYDLLVFEMNTNPAPTWTGIMVKMLGDNPNNCVPSSYYSSVRRCLKEIDVCYFDSTKRCMVKGKNWDRFVSGESWNWFTMRTGSREYSTINY
jgi:hypothetical protein